MTVKELIEALESMDGNNLEVRFWDGHKEYFIQSIENIPGTDDVNIEIGEYEEM